VRESEFWRSAFSVTTNLAKSPHFFISNPAIHLQPLALRKLKTPFSPSRASRYFELRLGRAAFILRPPRSTHESESRLIYMNRKERRAVAHKERKLARKTGFPSPEPRPQQPAQSVSNNQIPNPSSMNPKPSHIRPSRKIALTQIATLHNTPLIGQSPPLVARRPPRTSCVKMAASNFLRPKTPLASKR